MGRKWRILVFFMLVMLFGGIIGSTTQGITNNIKLGLDLQGGFEILYKVKPAKEGEKITKETLKNTVRALDKRINVLGVSEPRIFIEGKDRIRVQLAGVKDQKKAREILSTEAKLTFRDVNDNVLMDGSDLNENGAQQAFDEQNRPNVALTLKDAKKFKDVTTKILSMKPNNLLVIWLDFEEGKDSYKIEALKPNPKFLSAATVDQVFTQTDVTITGGSFTVESAKELSDLLNAGSLPVDLDEIYSTSIGAQFGDDALKETILAGIITVALIFIFMLVFYRLPGVIAIISLSVYIYVVLQVFDWMNGVMTLPGIAALILGIGMAVDANIITYERIKDELKLGKSVSSAFRAGNKRSFTTILDANLTTLLAAAVLFYFGTSSVKGFATMLLLSNTAVFLTNVILSRLLLSLLVHSKALNGKLSWFSVKQSEVLSISEKNPRVPTMFDKIDFVAISKYFVWFAICTAIIGVVVLSVFKLNLGIDFASGSRYEVVSNKEVTVEEIKKDFAEFNKEPKEVVLAEDNKFATVTFKGAFSKEEVIETKEYFKKKYGEEPNVSTVSPEVGKELARNALISVIIASIGIIIYVAFRFELLFGIAAVVALFHDAFLVITAFSIFRIEVDITFIAAILTIIGYSVNDTIVTFDRIRENLESTKKVKGYDDLKHIVNESIRQTLIRSLNTVLTVVIAALALYFIGSVAINNFSLALLIGLISGTYSSIFIASRLWLSMKTKQLIKLQNKPVTPE
ncbi:MAG: protein-export rane protein SecD [Bacillales bacterium]|jgi:SecD/SecF fusion protein|nr:protein-export rane protein SecD [Bacillales bacterium]